MKNILRITTLSFILLMLFGQTHAITKEGWWSLGTSGAIGLCAAAIATWCAREVHTVVSPEGQRIAAELNCSLQREGAIITRSHNLKHGSSSSISFPAGISNEKYLHMQQQWERLQRYQGDYTPLVLIALLGSGYISAIHLKKIVYVLMRESNHRSV